MHGAATMYLTQATRVHHSESFETQLTFNHSQLILTFILIDSLFITVILNTFLASLLARFSSGVSNAFNSSFSFLQKQFLNIQKLAQGVSERHSSQTNKP